MASTDPAHSDASLAALIPLGSHAKAAPIEIKRPVTLIGSRKEVVRLHLESSTVSKAHCVIVLNSWGCYVHDLASRTGTLVNGKAVVDADLADGDVLQVGRFQFKYRAPQRTRPKPLPLPPADIDVTGLPAPLVANKRVVVVGRRPGSDVELATDSRVSNIHAIVVEQDGRRIVRDLGSRTGTWIDDKPIHQDPLPDFEGLRVGGATITFKPRGTLAAAVNPAGAIPIPLDEAGPGFIGLDPLDADLDLDPVAPAETAVPVDDDLAALRRGWKTPARPAEPTIDRPAVTPPPEPEPLEFEPLKPEPAVPTPAAETPADADLLADADAPLSDDDLDLILAPARGESPPPETPRVDPEPPHVPPELAAAVADDDVLDLAPEPLVAPDRPVAEWVETSADAADVVEDAPAVLVPLDDDDLLDFDLPAPAAKAPAAAEPAAADTTPVDLVAEAESDAAAGPAVEDDTLAVVPADETVAPTPDAELLTLDDADTTTVSADAAPAPADVTVAAPGPVDDTAAGRAADDLLAGDGASVAGPVVAEAGTDDVSGVAVADAEAEPETVRPAPVADLAAAGLPLAAGTERTADERESAADILPAGLALTPEADEADAVAEAAPAAERTPADSGPAPEVESKDELETVAELTPAGLALTPESDEAETPNPEPLDFGDLTLEPDADAPEMAAGSDAVRADPDAPAQAPAAAVPVPFGLDTPSVTQPAHVVLPAEGFGADEDEVADLEPLDLDDLLAELDPNAPKTGGTDLDAELDTLLADPDAPAPETAEKQHGHAVSDVSVPLADTLAGVDLVELDEEPDAEPATADAGDDVAIGGVTIAPPPPEVASAETLDAAAPVMDRISARSTDADDSLAGTAFVEPAEVPAEPDLVRLEEAEDDNEATALAVDLGLVFDDEPDLVAPAPAPVAGPNRPVEIDLASAASTDERRVDDVFDADDVETVEPAAPVRPAAEAPKPNDDHIDAPQGGSLNDLMLGGPPLVGGSFMSMPPVLPSMPALPRDKRRPTRIGFGGEPARPANAPFAADRTIGNALGETEDDDFAGLADVKTAPIDAFGGAAKALRNGEAADGVDEAAPDNALAAPAERFRPRGTIAPVLPPARPAGPGVTSSVSIPPPVTPSASAEADASRADRHKKRVRRVIACLVGMIVLIGGAAWGVYYFTPLTSKIDALITYDGLDRLGIEDQTNFRVRQNDLLVSETTRGNAVAALPAGVKDPGFLASSKRIYETVSVDPKVRWPAEQQSVMRLQVRSVDKQDDVARLRALADEMVKAADGDVKKRNELSDQIREQAGTVNQLKSELSSLADQLQALKQASLAKSDVKNASELNAEYLAAEPAVTAIKAKRQELEATVERLSKPAAVAPSDAGGDAAAADQELATLTQQLTQVQQAGQRPPTEAGTSARKELDSLFSGFETDLNKAQQLGDSPQLAAYVEAAKSSFKQMRELTAGLIRRQENNLTRVSELKSTLSDKMQARTQQRLANDAELKKLRDNQAILERQFNAAKAQQLDQEAQKVELDLRVLKVKIAEREDNFKNDAVDSETIAGLQKIIDATEADIRADRKNIDDRLTAVQADFLKSTPGVEKLPAEQKALAEGIKKKLAAMNDARLAYDSATEKAQADQAKAETAAKEQVAALRLKIAARRQDVLAAAQAKQAENDEATRKTRLAAAQAELVDVRLQEQNALHRLADATTAIEANEKQRRVNAQADADRQAKIAQQDELGKQFQRATNRASALNAELAKLIVPDRKVEVIPYDEADRRPALLAGIVGGIVALLLVPILLDLLALYRETHPAAVTAEPTHAADEGFEPLLADDAVVDRKALPEPV